MNGFVLAALIVLVVVITVVAGCFVFVLVQTLFNTGASITSIQTRLNLDETSLTATRAETAQVATSIIANIASNVVSSKLTVTGTKTKIAGDNNLNITANQVPNATTNLSDPSRGAGWLYLTDSLGKNYASLGVANMWADKGITVSPGSCIDFGGGSAMCGDGSGALTGHTTTGTGGTAVTSGVTLVVAPGKCKFPQNILAGNTLFPSSTGNNIIVGDTQIGGFLEMTGELIMTGNDTGAGGGSISASLTGTRVVANLTDVTIPAKVGLGFAPIAGGNAEGFVDALVITRSLTDNKNITKVIGSFQVCDDNGANCVAFPPVQTPVSTAVAIPAIKINTVASTVGN